MLWQYTSINRRGGVINVPTYERTETFQGRCDPDRNAGGRNDHRAVVALVGTSLFKRADEANHGDKSQISNLMTDSAP